MHVDNNMKMIQMLIEKTKRKRTAMTLQIFRHEIVAEPRRNLVIADISVTWKRE